MRTKQQREATQRCEAGGRAGEHRDGWTDRQGRSYLLNLLVAGRHGRKNATKVKRQGKKMLRASKIIEEDPETWAKTQRRNAGTERKGNPPSNTK